jgi:hypothetical protein
MDCRRRLRAHSSRCAQPLRTARSYISQSHRHHQYPVPQYLILITNGTRQSHAVSASIESFENGWHEVNQGIHSLSLLSGTAVTTILPRTAHPKRRIALRCFPLNGSRWRERLLADGRDPISTLQRLPANRMNRYQLSSRLGSGVSNNGDSPCYWQLAPRCSFVAPWSAIL